MISTRNTISLRKRASRWMAVVLAALLPLLAWAEEAIEPLAAEVLSPDALEALVAPVALYPDDLLAIVLPASTFPLQVVQAARFLDAAQTDSTLKPDEDWDDSVVALLNYPEALELLSEDLDWTWELGQAVLAQQADVVAAVATFRDRAHTAGNLRSDDRQIVEVDDGAIHIKPADPKVIYVPYYEPARVVVYQPAPVYYYYPRAYPVYYYPYPVGYRFYSGYFWGVTSYYTLGWHTRHVHVHHHYHQWHPYYRARYDYGRHYYRRPRTTSYHYADYRPGPSRYHRDNAWKPDHRRARPNPGRPHYWARNDRHDGRRYEERRDDGRRAFERRDDERRDGARVAAPDARYRDDRREPHSDRADRDRGSARFADRTRQTGPTPGSDNRARFQAPDRVDRKQAPVYRAAQRQPREAGQSRPQRATPNQALTLQASPRAQAQVRAQPQVRAQQSVRAQPQRSLEPSRRMEPPPAPVQRAAARPAAPQQPAQVRERATREIGQSRGAERGPQRSTQRGGQRGFTPR
jgi:hypothetical protein